MKISMICLFAACLISNAYADCQSDFARISDLFSYYWQLNADQNSVQYDKYISVLSSIREHWARIRSSEKFLELMPTRERPQARLLNIGELATLFENWPESWYAAQNHLVRLDATEYWFADMMATQTPAMMKTLSELWNLFPDDLNSKMNTSGTFEKQTDGSQATNYFLWHEQLGNRSLAIQLERFFRLQKVSGETELDTWAKSGTFAEYTGFVSSDEMLRNLFNIVLNNTTLYCVRQDAGTRLSHVWNNWAAFVHDSRTRYFEPEFLDYLRESLIKSKVPKEFISDIGEYTLFPKVLVWTPTNLNKHPTYPRHYLEWLDMPSSIPGFGVTKRLKTCKFTYDVGADTRSKNIEEVYKTDPAYGDCKLGNLSIRSAIVGSYYEHSTSGYRLPLPVRYKKHVKDMTLSLEYTPLQDASYFDLEIKIYHFKKVNTRIQRPYRSDTQSWSFYFVKDPVAFAQEQHVDAQMKARAK